MFKKNISVAGTHQLGGKDAKKFKACVEKSYPHLTAEELATLIPPKSAVTQIKLNNRALVYSIDNSNPLFFDPNGHGDALLPTVTALSIIPHLVPTLYTHSEVSSKIIGGADLFLQGIIIPPDGIPDFLANSIRSVSVPGNVPFAIGKMAVSKRQAENDGMKGAGVSIIHSYGDLLWQLGDKQPINEGFLKDRVVPIVFRDADTEKEEGNEEEQGNDSVSTATENIEQSLLELSIKHPEQVPQRQQPNTTTAVEECGVSLDELLEQAAIGGLHSLKNADMPIDASNFYSKHMQPLKPDGVTFDFKRSKYKKLSKLLDHFEKEKLIKQKQVRKQDHITEVNRTHPLYASWTPAVLQTASSLKNNTNTVSNRKATTSAEANANSISIELLYKPSSTLRPLFNGQTGLVQGKDTLYTEEQVQAALKTYLASQNLVQGSGANLVDNCKPSTHITIDELFATSLWGKKEGPQTGDAIPYTNLFNRLMSKLQPWYKIIKGTDIIIRKGSIKPIQVISERRHGRNITAVSHVESLGFVADELAALFQKKFQASCSISKLPGKTETDMEVMLQGDVMKKMVEYSSGTLGVDRKYIESSTKLKK